MQKENGRNVEEEKTAGGKVTIWGNEVSRVQKGRNVLGLKVSWSRTL